MTCKLARRPSSAARPSRPFAPDFFSAERFSEEQPHAKANTGCAEAFRLATELRPDVTLVDVDLGEEDGFEVARRLSDEGMNVILVSTHSEQDLAPLIAASPALGFIAKARLSAQAIRDTLGRAA